MPFYFLLNTERNKRIILHAVRNRCAQGSGRHLLHRKGVSIALFIFWNEINYQCLLRIRYQESFVPLDRKADKQSQISLDWNEFHVHISTRLAIPHKQHA